jgi:hypothetical protein
MVDLEITLIKEFHWSLYEIDKTDISSLIPFIDRFVAVGNESVGNKSASKRVYCDEIDF